MNAILEFVHAALPWAILGVAVAVLCVRHGGQQKQEKSRQDYSGEGMCLGVGWEWRWPPRWMGRNTWGWAFRWECWRAWPLVPVWKSRIREQT